MYLVDQKTQKEANKPIQEHHKVIPSSAKSTPMVNAMK